jgi:hypothetical protein
LLAAASALVPLQAGTFNNNFDTDPTITGAVTLDGTAKWVATGGVGGSGYIYLTGPVVMTPSEAGLLIVPDLDNGDAVGGFTATFKMQVGPGSGNPADGFSFNWASDLPTNAGSVSEEGAGTGLTIAFDIYDNGGGEAPSIDVKVGGTTVAQHKMTKNDGSATDIMTSGFADVRIQYKDGLLDVDYKGQSIYASLPLGLAPQNAATFEIGARTGGEAAAQYVDNLSITTYPPTAPVVTTVRSNAKGLLVNIVDAPTAQVDPTSVSATIDNAAVTGTATKNGDTTTYTFNNSGLYIAGSTHNVVLTYKYGTPATTVTTPLSFTVGAFTTLPASAALGSVPAKRGFLWRVHQIDATPTLANSMTRTEQQLSGLLGDNLADPAAQNGADATSTPPNPSTAPIAFTVSNVINFTDATDGTDSGRFGSDTIFPGIPGTGGGADSIAGEVITGVEFPTPGIYRLVVNSDDGFRTTAGKNPRDPSNPVLGEFNQPGGRGPADSPFEVYVDTAGVYPMRTIWEEGGGGAALEIFSESMDGSRHLLNDSTDANALKTYQLPASALPAYLGATTPGSKDLVRPATIEAHLFDSGTTVTANSVSMKLNGATIPVTATKNGIDTKVVGTPAGGLTGDTQYTVDLTYSDDTGPHTVSWTFTAGPLSTTLFAIEAEDFDYSDDGVTGGLHNPLKGTAGSDVDVMPYYGGAYEGLSAVRNVDYFGDDPDDQGLNYRTESFGASSNDVSIYANNNAAGGAGLGGDFSINSSDRGTYQTTVNYSLGWSGGDWYNYTRDFPDNGKGGWWEVYMGQSFGGGTAPGGISSTLSLVTAGVGTDTQTTALLGSFSGPGTGGWGNNDLVPMRTAAGAKAVVKLQGLQTVRATISSGDYNFFIFSAANPPPPSIDQAPLDSVKRDAAIFDWVIKDGGSQVNTATVKVMINNQDVTSKTTVTKTATGATVHVDLSSTLLASGEMPWTLTFNDNAASPQTVTGSGTLVVNPYPTPGVFVIEAEDFNYSDDDITGGKTNPQKGTADKDVDVMPYLGDAYTGLSAIKGVDYVNADGNDSDVYRTEKDANGENEVNITLANGNRYSNDRGVFTTTTNYRIGWTGAGDWANYTRTFPANDYTVWAALSYDGRGAGLMRGSLDLVTTDPTQPNQNILKLGDFNAGASGGWGRNELVPMKTNGVIATIHLGGVQTVRFDMPSGDFDYVVFVPTTSAPPAPKFTSIARNTDGTITIQWTGTGTLQTATSITGSWTDVPGATSPFNYTPPAGEQMRFVRIKQP